MQLVLATSDAAYKNNNVPGPVSVKVDPSAPSALVVPAFGVPGIATAAPAPVPTTKAAAKPGAGQSPQVAASSTQKKTATLPKQCVSRRAFVIRIKRVKKPDAIRSAV